VSTRKTKTKAKPGRSKKKVTVRKRKTKAKTKRSTRRKRPKNSEARSRRRFKSKLTHKLIDEAVELIKEGLPLESVCAYLGITDHTLYDWKEKGEKYLIEVHTERGPEFPEDELEAEFLLAVAKARASLELEIVKDLRDNQALARWVRNTTILERRFRRSWGRSESLRVETESISPDEAYL